MFRVKGTEKEILTYMVLYTDKKKAGRGRMGTLWLTRYEVHGGYHSSSIF